MMLVSCCTGFLLTANKKSREQFEIACYEKRTKNYVVYDVKSVLSLFDILRLNSDIEGMCSIKRADMPTQYVHTGVYNFSIFQYTIAADIINLSRKFRITRVLPIHST